jgi:hypothetical protein
MPDYSDKKQKKTELSLMDNYYPTLASGKYRLNVRQSINLNNTKQSSFFSEEDEQFISKEELEFIVEGPRFRIDQSDIHSLYPAQQSQADYSGSLSHIVFNKRTLPWERKVSSNENQRPPWMALILFREQELLDGISPELMQKNQVTANCAIRGSLKDFVNSHSDSSVLYPKLDSTSGAELEQYIEWIQIPLSDFKTQIKSFDEQAWLSHCRQVDTDNKVPLDLKDNGMFSVCMGNRLINLPDQNNSIHPNVQPYIAHLVSLEGLDSMLQPRVITAPDNINKVALISLFSWRFTHASDDKESFKNLAKGLNRQDNLLLRLSVPTPAGKNEQERQLKQRIDAGFVPLAFHILTGEDTLAWYRGPLSPIRTAGFSEEVLFTTTSKAMIYDMDEGLFDHSYSAAWQLGRSLSLANQNFSYQVFDYKRRQYEEVILLFERSQSPYIQDKSLENLLSSTPVLQAFNKELQTNKLEGFNEYINSDDIQKNVGIIPENEKEYKEKLELFLRNDKDKFKKYKIIEPSFDMRQRLKDNISKLMDDLLPQLAQWYLFHQIPFQYLVANEKLLPTESLRFFYVDQQWQHALIDGALSVGMSSSFDAEFYQIVKQTVYRQVQTHCQHLRQQGISPKDNNGKETVSDQIGLMSGVIVRSNLVVYWPGLEVEAFDENGELLVILRMDHLSEEVLLVIVSGIIATIHITEPLESLSFCSVETPPPIRDKDMIDIQSMQKSLSKSQGANKVGSAALALHLQRLAQRITIKEQST